MADNNETFRTVTPRLPTWFLGVVAAFLILGWWGIRRPPGPFDVSGTVASAEHAVTSAGHQIGIGTGQNSSTAANSGTAANSENQGSSVSAADQAFASTAASGGLAEVQMGQLAQQHAVSDATKQFATQIVADHTKANQELQQIAKDLNIPLPTEPSSEQALTLTVLQSLPASAFDKTYAEVMVRDHQSTIAAFQNAASSGQNAQLKSFAQTTLPILQHHLQMAEELAKSIASNANASVQGGSAPN